MTVEELGEQYCLIGPYNEACVRTEVEIMEPYNEAMRAAIAQMRDHGIKVGTEITHTSQRIGEGNVFSRVCLSGILSKGAGGPCTGYRLLPYAGHWLQSVQIWDPTAGHVQTCSTWTSLYRAPIPPSQHPPSGYIQTCAL